MTAIREKSADLPATVRRITALVVAISCHLGLLIILLRPADGRGNNVVMADDQRVELELRLIAVLPMSASRAPQALAARHGSAEKVKSLQPHRAIRVVAKVNADSSRLLSPSVTTADPSLVEPSYGSATSPITVGDGGFQQRLLNSQHSQGVRGVPGSDLRAAPGIQLTDPRDQGIGAVTRNTQRLFGITNHHCIDVEVWQSLSPEELSARHLTPDDVRSEGEKYKCNSPLGLSL